MLRIIVRTDDAGMAANVGGSVHSEFRTFDIDAPEIVDFLKNGVRDYAQRQIVGVEVIVAA